MAARVAVNRIWAQHFGRGIVRTAGDFGVKGDPPSHPELLDWLAAEFIRGGWKSKPIHRLIVTSKTWQQAAAPASSAGRASDHENYLLSYFPRRRLSAEMIRDGLMAISGCLNRQALGPSVFPHLDENAALRVAAFYDFWPEDAADQPSTWRRSLYCFNKRSIQLPFLQVFDAPRQIASTSNRILSTTPTQGLTLLNDPFTRDQAAHFARRIRQDASAPADQISRAFLLALSRPATDLEISGALAYIAQAANPDVGFTDFAHTLFLSNEFLHLE